MLLLSEINDFTLNIKEKVYEPLLMFGEEKEFFDATTISANKEFYITKIVGVLNEIHEIVKNLNVLLKNLLNQLHNLYNKTLKEYHQVFKKILLVEAFDCLGRLLV